VLGYLQKDRQLTAFLSPPQGGDVYLVQVGDRFADDLLVKEIGGGKITISRNLSDPGVTLSLGEAKALRMPVVSVPSNRPNVPIIEESAPEPPKPEEPADGTAGGNPVDP